MSDEELWRMLLHEHAAWVNQEKQIIWRRFAAYVPAVTVYFTGSVIAYNNERFPICAVSIFSLLGLFICGMWFWQIIYGWSLLNKRLKYVGILQEKISEQSLKDWPLAFRIRGEQKWDQIMYSSALTAFGFIIAFIVLAIAVNARPTP
jgi:hypothetical protein